MTALAYDYNIVLDLEFTPIPHDLGTKRFRYEVIEIGAVRVDPKGTLFDTFDCLVKPSRTPRVSGQVRHLTGIRDSDLEDAEPFEQAFQHLVDWVGPSHRSRIIAWSPTDRRQIEAECAAKGVEIPAHLTHWLDLQRVYPRMLGVHSRGSMALRDAAYWAGEEFDARRAHRALYDAEVTAGLLRTLLTGEYREQRSRYATIMPQTFGGRSTECTASLGSRCGGLADLLARMTGGNAGSSSTAYELNAPHAA